MNKLHYAIVLCVALVFLGRSGLALTIDPQADESYNVLLDKEKVGQEEQEQEPDQEEDGDQEEDDAQPTTAKKIYRSYLKSSDKCAIPRSEFRGYAKVLRKLQYPLYNPYEFSNDEAGFSAFLKAVGVRYFTGEAAIDPYEPEKAKKAGFDNFLPQQCRWLGGAAMLVIADKIREMTGDPIHLRNWWRPRAYNRLFHDTAKRSDHLDARAIDIDFLGERAYENKRDALKWLCKEFWTKPGWSIQIGVYSSVALHIGLHSPKRGGRKRNWGVSGPCQTFRYQKPIPIPPLPERKPSPPEEASLM